MELQVVAFFVLAYLMPGLVTIVRGFTTKNPAQIPIYIQRGMWLMTPVVAVLWPVLQVFTLAGQRRTGLKHILLLVTNGLYGLSAYGASISGLITILDRESDNALKTLEIAGLLVFLAVVILWLFSRYARGLMKFRGRDPSALEIMTMV